jgi:hypothetical protein
LGRNTAASPSHAQGPKQDEDDPQGIEILIGNGELVEQSDFADNE